MLKMYENLEQLANVEEQLAQNKTDIDVSFLTSEDSTNTVDFRSKNDTEIVAQRYSNSVVKNLYLGSVLNKIGTKAFYNVRDLESVTIPKSVQNIEFNAFASDSIKRVTVVNSNRTGSGVIFANSSIMFTFRDEVYALDINVIQPKTKYMDVKAKVLESFSHFVRDGFKMDEYVDLILQTYDIEFANLEVLHSMLKFVTEFQRLSNAYTDETLRDAFISDSITLEDCGGFIKNDADRKVVNNYFSVFWNKESAEEPDLITTIKEAKKGARFKFVKDSIESMIETLRESPQYLYYLITTHDLYNEIENYYEAGIIDVDCSSRLQFMSHLDNNVRLQRLLHNEYAMAMSSSDNFDDTDYELI